MENVKNNTHKTEKLAKEKGFSFKNMNTVSEFKSLIGTILHLCHMPYIFVQKISC